MSSLEQLLAGRQLSKIVEGVKSGLPLRIPETFLQRTDEIHGHVCEYYETDGNRDLATVVAQDSPAKRIGHQGVKTKSATMLRTFESQAFNANKLRNVVDPESKDAARDERGKAFVRRNTEWFKRRQMNLVQTTAQVMLCKFALHFDENGNLLPSSSGATVSIDPAIPAGQKDQLDILGDGAIIGDSWATATTDIVGHTSEIVRQMLRLGGWPIRHAFYGANIPGYIATNNSAKEYIDRTPALATQRYEGANIVPDGFQDLMWHPMKDAFYIDSAGTVQNIIGDDEIVFTPEPSDEWWRYFVGSEMIPGGTMQIGQSIDEMMGALTEVFGSFSYAALSHNPVSVEWFSGLNWLPVIVATKAVCRADVTP